MVTTTTVKYKTINGRRFASSVTTTSSSGKSSTRKIDTSSIEAQQKASQESHYKDIAKARGISVEQVKAEIALQEKQKKEQETITKEIKQPVQAGQQQPQQKPISFIKTPDQRLPTSTQYNDPNFLLRNREQQQTQPQNVYREATKSEKITTKQKLISSAERKIREGKTPIIEPTALFFVGIGESAKQAYDVVRHPIKTTKSLFIVGKEFVTSPIETTSKIATSFSKELETNPYGFAGQVVGDVLLGKGIQKVSQAVTNIKIKAGAEYVPEEQVFSSQVLEQGKTFPLAKSSQEVTEKVIKSDFVVTTASPSKLKGDVAGAGRKGIVGLEDQGIFTTPKGEGSPAFLRIDEVDDLTSYDFTLNPFKTQRPTVAEFTTKGISEVPKDVLSKAGFYDVSEYATKNIAPLGEVYVSKRSQIGFGELPRQEFVVKETFTSPISDRVIPKGAKIVEAGTSEIETIIPAGTPFIKSTAPKTFTTYKGQPVAIDKYSLVATDTAQDVSSQSFKAQETFSKYSGDFSYVVSGSKSTPISPSIIIPKGTSIGKSSSSGVTIFKPIQTYSFDFSKLTVKFPVSSYLSQPKPTDSFSLLDKSIVRKPYPIKPYSKIKVTPTSTPISRPSSTSGGSTSGGSSTGSSSTTSEISSPTSSTTASSVITSTSEFTTSSTPSKRKKFDFEQNKSLFDVYVRKKGKFVKAGEGFDLQTAIRKGKEIVGTTASASFKVVERKSQRVVNLQGLGLSNNRFYASRKESGVIIEKPSKRIKSLGELREITFKGIQTQRRTRF